MKGFGVFEVIICYFLYRLFFLLINVYIVLIVLNIKIKYDVYLLFMY